MRALLTSAILALASANAFATTHQFYNRTDAGRVEAARAWLDSHGHDGVTVRAFRGRLTLGGALPSGADLDSLERDLRAASGATSVHH